MGDGNSNNITGILVMSWEPATHGTQVSVMSCRAVAMAWGIQGRAMTTRGSTVMTYHGMSQASVGANEGRHLCDIILSITSDWAGGCQHGCSWCLWGLGGHCQSY